MSAQVHLDGVSVLPAPLNKQKHLPSPSIHVPNETPTLPIDTMSPAALTYADDAKLAIPELDVEEPRQMVDMIRAGLPAERFDVLREALDVSTRELLDLIGLTKSTLSRRRRRGHFDSDESDRILRVARLFTHAVRAMEGRENARRWLKEPARALGGERPLAFADTEPGAREVERLLLRIEHGVFS